MNYFSHKPEEGIYRMKHGGEETRFVAFIELQEDTDNEGMYKLTLKDDYLWQVKIPTVKSRKGYESIDAAHADAQGYVNKQYK